MKEIIEYILATLIILSFVPIYTYITHTLYIQPATEPEPTVLALFTENIKDILEEIGTAGNLTSPTLDLDETIRDRLGSLYQDYGFHIEISSANIVDLKVSGNKVEVYTLDDGNVSILVIYSDSSWENKTLTTPTNVFQNGTRLYSFAMSSSNIIFVSAILDTGTHRFIRYYIENNVKILYPSNYGGNIVLLNNLSQGSITNYKIYNNIYGVNLTIYYYSKNSYGTYNETSFEYGFSISSIYKYVNHTDIRYYLIYERNVQYKGSTYEVYNVSLAKNSSLLQCYYYWWWGLWICWVLDTSFIMEDINSPVYNIIAFHAVDNNGDHYIGVWYPQNLSIGDPIPSGWPVRKIMFIQRIGMIDYYVTVYIWRRTI